MAYDEELIAKGELRKACSKRGNAIPPARRVNTTMRWASSNDAISTLYFYFFQVNRVEAYNEFGSSAGHTSRWCLHYHLQRRTPGGFWSVSRKIRSHFLICPNECFLCHIFLLLFQSVEVDEYDRRREYISGFSGSYGDAIVTMDKAVLWTDGRYHLQADEQVDCNWLLMREGHKNIPTRYIEQIFLSETYRTTIIILDLGGSSLDFRRARD